MATRPPRFTPIPNIPQQGLTSWQFQTLTAMKENIDLLTGARGAGSGATALTTGSVTVTPAPVQTMQRVTATTAGFTINNVSVPSLDDYTKLVTDVQLLANDVAALRATVNALINQLKG